MSLNKFLCKWFDDEKKGYVTIGDAVISIVKILMIGIFACMLLFLIGGLTSAFVWTQLTPYSSNLAECMANNKCTDIKANILGVLYGVGIDLLIVIICVILYKIGTIRIAKCNR